MALKVMHGSLAEDHDFVARFVREARSAAQLTHPAIVAVYDQGESDGFVYLAMEYVEGQTLRDVLNDRGRLTAPQALAVLEPILEALTAAHAAGFAHRDIKPENVLLATDGRVKVADFGLARAIMTTNASGLTQGLLIGTVAYLAPEQVERGHADAQTDVYSAGILLYESVVGQPPFSGETPLSVAYQHVHSHVPAPSAIRAQIPSQIDELVAIATAQDPKDRYQDASDFAAHLRTLRAELPSEGEFGAGESDDQAQHHTVILDASSPTISARTYPQQTTPGLNAATVTTATAPPAAQTSPTLVTPAPAVAPMVGPPGGPWVSDAPSPAPSAPHPSDVTAAMPPSDQPPEPLATKRRPRRFRVLIAILILTLLGTIAGFGAWAYTTSQLVTMPTLVGLTPSAASTVLEPDGVTLQVTGENFSAAVPKGAIVSTEPSAGSQIKRGETVSAVTSAGPQMVDIPNLVGKKQSKAESNLRALGFPFTVSEEFSDSVATGRVISNSPKSGKSVPVGTDVSFVVSKGPPPVTVPNVVGSGQDSAVAQLRALGLRPVVSNQLPVVVIGRVYSQDPGPGTVVPKGTTINLTVV